MLELVGTEIGDIGRELGVIIAKLLDLRYDRPRRGYERSIGADGLAAGDD